MKISISQLFGTGLPINYRTEILSGLTVSLSLVPEAVAFALLAGFSPLTGLYASFTIGFVTAILGGRPGMISGAAGAVAVIFLGLISKLRETIPDISNEQILHFVFATIILGGVIQILAGVFKLGKFIRLVPKSVMFGFLNGLALIIFLAQFPTFGMVIEKNAALGGWFSSWFGIVGGGVVDGGLLNDGLIELGIMVALVLGTMAIIWALPKFTKVVPASLAGIVVISLIVWGFGIETATVSDMLKPGQTLQGGFPPFSLPDIEFTWSNLMLILPFAGILAGVGLIESLLTLNVIDEITETRGNSNRECVAQGVANVTTGFFSGMGGCGMLGQSLVNISSGARTRISSIIGSVMLLVFIMFASGVIERLPMAALVGVMFMIAIETFEWTSLRTFRKMPKSDVVVMVFVTLITVFTHNIGIAVLSGVILSAVTYAWENAKRIRMRIMYDSDGEKHYEVSGPLFFASVKSFTEYFDPANDPDQIVIDFLGSRIADMSAIEAVNGLTARYKKYGKTVHLRHLSEDCRKLLCNADAIIDVNVMEDPTYRLPLDHPGRIGRSDFHLTEFDESVEKKSRRSKRSKRSKENDSNNQVCS